MFVAVVYPVNFFNSGEFLRSLIIWLPSLLIWSLFWKGYALWQAARNKQKTWFILLLIIHTLGILEIIYLTLLQKDNNPRVALVKHTLKRPDKLQSK